MATSAAVVNEVVGVSASHLDYTHNFAILLYLPAWFVVMSGIVLLAMQIIIPFYFMLTLLLKPLGIATIRFTAHSKFRKSTALLRLILASIVLYHLGLLIDVEEAVVVSEETLVSIVNVDNKLSDLTQEEPLLAVKPEPRKKLQSQKKDQQEQNYDELRQHYQHKVREMIAIFAYNLEADSRSRCEKAQDSSVVELNDYEVLEITKDKDAQYGFQFEVKKCVSAAFPLR